MMYPHRLDLKMQHNRLLGWSILACLSYHQIKLLTLVVFAAQLKKFGGGCGLACQTASYNPTHSLTHPSGTDG